MRSKLGGLITRPFPARRPHSYDVRLCDACYKRNNGEEVRCSKAKVWKTWEATFAENVRLLYKKGLAQLIAAHEGLDGSESSKQLLNLAILIHALRGTKRLGPDHLQSI